MKLPKITEKTIKEHLKAIKNAKRSKSFKSKSDKIFEEILKENPELTEIIIPTLESKKPEEYKKGYLAGITTIYDILRRQAKKDNFSPFSS
jgi:hypothetical protein